ncbi:glycerophosphodiester phosphodiesterase [Thermoplasma sp.]|uniref:glycerophosphodiester phosphodiesterase n=1 Tax=Thermoplasma sp. TaxID=1973142 RepID=UPI00128737C4|nr:glycerophosphodiester phosphodiesterase [Thermoplasma sp.]KAA8923523.1 MAG: glycerophosphodiester phosphodiesterase [Thermoplasma sp.]
MHFLDKYKFIVVGHRGLPSVCLENTMDSFKTAFNAGIPAVELDVQPTADGVPVVFHDFDLKRLTGNGSKISELKWDELSRIKLMSGSSIPRFSEVISAFRKYNFFIEIKIEKFGERERKLTDDVARMIIDEGMTDNVVLISFDKSAMQHLRDHYIGVMTGLDFESPDDSDEAVKNDVALPYYAIVDGVFEKIKIRPVIPWTVDSYSTAVHLKKLGCRGVITNTGDRLMSLME